MGALPYVWMIWGRVRRQQRTFPRGSWWHFRVWVGVLGSEKSSGDSSENAHLELCLLFVCLFFNPRLRACLLMFFREGRERERERSVASCTRPDQGSNLKPRYMPWLGTEHTTFWGTEWRSDQLSHLARAELCLYFGTEFWLISNCCFLESHKH